MFSPMALQQMWERAWPIISLLLACSVLSGAIILERWMSLTRASFNREALLSKLQKFFAEKENVDLNERAEKPKIGNAHYGKPEQSVLAQPAQPIEYFVHGIEPQRFVRA